MDLLQVCILHSLVPLKKDYKVDTFMHAPNYNYNEVMRILEFAAVIGPQAHVGEVKNV